jgi:lambda family phage tail tape measure protein
MARELDFGIRIRAKDETAAAFRSAQQGARSFSSQLDSARRALITFFSLAAATRAASEIIRVADAYQQVNARLRLAVTSTQEYVSAQTALFQIAQATRSEISGTVDLYTRLARSTKDLGASQATLLAVTETVNKAIQLSGVSAESANAALVQLSQGLAAGALRGDELRSVLEQTPRLAEALAQGLGVSIGELRSLGEQGKLTAEAIINSLLKAGETVNKEFGQMPATVGQALTQVGNAWARFIGQSNESAGATRSLASALSALAQNFNAFAENAVRLGGIIATVYAAQVIKSIHDWIVAQLAGLQVAAAARAAHLAELQAKVRVTEATAIYTQMLLAEAQAAVAAATGMQRLILVETQLIAVQKAAAASAAEAAAAQKALDAAMTTGALGGIKGLLKGLFSLNAVFAALIGWQIGSWLRDEFEVARKAGIALAGGLHETFASLKGAILVVGETISFAFDHPLDMVRGKLDVLRERIKAINAETQKELAQVRDGYSELFAAENKTSAPDVGATGGSTAPTPVRRAPTSIPDPDVTRARLDSIAAITKDHIQRERESIDASYAQSLISLRDYFTRRTALTQQGLDAEIVAGRAALDEARREEEKARAKVQTTQPGESREQALGDLKKAKENEIKAEGDLIRLQEARTAAGIAGTRDLRAAEQIYADEVSQILERTLEAQGQTAEARGLALEREFRGTLARMKQEGDTVGQTLIENLIDTEKARALLDQFQKDYDRALVQMQATETDINTQRAAGMIGETEARRRIIDLHQRTAASMETVIQKMREQADLIRSDSPEATAAIDRTIAGWQRLSQEIDPIAQRINDSVEKGLADSLYDFIIGTKTAKEAFQDFARSVVSAIARIAAEKMAAAIFGGMAGGGVGGLIASIFHSGGVVGSGGTRRAISPLAFAGAPRMHAGGIAGLKSDEVPAILQSGETVIPRGQTRSGGGQSDNVKVIIENKGAPIAADNANASFDAEGMVVRIVVGDAARGGPISSTLARTFNLRRGGG